ncbi:hypothetical protein VB712_03140 [Spirulina sp. CCNP1310]|uniref:hypothetical protein n=1 Tax=Spirulina sp. CCNP1310 TaxID=3110249 RepID=UPI002B220235|nr:hypothetical protein [Spirulina sp. CCNP1310]MEA5418204.1 hypothetical protein [Spirulina sp. CCNP1310]
MVSLHYSGVKMFGGFLGASLLLFQGVSWTNSFPVFAQSPETRPPECDENGDCPRGDLDPNTPHIISPRNSYILSDRPLIRWYQVEGATRYLVKIQGPNLQWQTETTDPFVTYNGENLVRGEEYSVIVSTHDGEHQDRASFIWLNTEQEQDIQGAIATLSRDLTPQEEALAIAAIYEQHFLFNDAIAVLETHLEELGGTKVIYDELVDLYRQIDLTNKVKFYQEQNSNPNPSI